MSNKHAVKEASASYQSTPVPLVNRELQSFITGNPLTDNLNLWISATKAKSTSGRGSNKKIELVGIKKLRELILELAVRGKLVPQNPEDEPASELLKKIDAEKAKLIAEGKIKKQKKLPEISEDEKPFELPEGWELVRFGRVIDFQGGSQPPKSQFIDRKEPGYIQLIQIRDLGPKPQPVFVPESTVSKLCNETDILIGRYGASVGKVFWGKTGAYNVALIKLIFDQEKINSRYIFTLMASPMGQALFGGISRSAQDGFSKADIESQLITLPPLAEQHRIVAKVDELMALCDQLEQHSEHQLDAHKQLVETLLATLVESENADELTTNWQRLAEHFDTLFSGALTSTTGIGNGGGEWAIDRLKDTILQLAVMGKLVPQNPDDEPASELLKKIETEKAKLVKEGKIKKPKKLPPVSDEEKPFELPEGWEWVQLNDVTKDLKYGTSKKCDYPTRNTAVLRIPNVVSGVVNLEDIKYTDMSDKELHDLTLSSGDLLFIRSNGSTDIVGRCAVIEKNIPGYAYAGYLVRCRTFSNSISSIYLKKCMDSSNTRAQIELPIRTTSGVKNINSTELNRITFPLPPLAEQHRIVAKVDELFALCDQLKDRLQQASETQQHLTKAIVEQALS
jgi:type I restriction enzyme S subunit